MVALAFLGPIGPTEGLVILVIGLLVFGARLPEVGRQLGRGLMEFKKGLRGIQDEVRSLESSADRELEADLARRRAAATPHELEEDPRGEEAPKAPFAHEFVPGDPARGEAERAAQSARRSEDDAIPPVGTPYRDPAREPGAMAPGHEARPGVEGTSSFSKAPASGAGNASATDLEDQKPEVRDPSAPSP